MPTLRLEQSHTMTASVGAPCDAKKGVLAMVSAEPCGLEPLESYLCLIAWSLGMGPINLAKDVPFFSLSL